MFYTVVSLSLGRGLCFLRVSASSSAY